MYGASGSGNANSSTSCINSELLVILKLVGVKGVTITSGDVVTIDRFTVERKSLCPKC